MFRADLVAALGPRDRTKCGRPGFDPVLKFRMLVLQAMHGLSLDQTEYLVADRLSWMRFCGLGPGDGVPDANKLWDFREALIGVGALDALFTRLDRAITQAGYLPMLGQIVDATLVAAPHQRNTTTEKAAIKEGRSAEEIWPEKPAKARQKDVEARWTISTPRPQSDRPVDRLNQPWGDAPGLGIFAHHQAVGQELSGRQDVAQIVADRAHHHSELGEPMVVKIMDQDQQARPAVLGDGRDRELRGDQLAPLARQVSSLPSQWP